jgi:hypothetical protein
MQLSFALGAAKLASTFGDRVARWATASPECDERKKTAGASNFRQPATVL